MTPEQQQALTAWQEESEGRIHGRRRPVKRGSSRSRAAAAGAWRCEGRWQCDEQMDIWACIDEAVIDERRKRGEHGDED